MGVSLGAWVKTYTYIDARKSIGSSVLNFYLFSAKKYVFLGDRGFQADMPPRKYFDKESFNYAAFASDVQYWSGILNSNLAVVSK